MKKMLYKVFCLIVFGFATNYVFCQFECVKDNPITLEVSNFSQEGIQNIIKQNSKTYTDYDIKQITKCLIEYRQKIESEIKKRKDEILELSAKRQNLLSNKNLPELLAQINKNKENLESIKTQLKNDLSNISTKAMYLCIINKLDPLKHSKSELQQMAIAAILPSAIEQINGSFIQAIDQKFISATNAYNNYSSYIKETISGELSINKILYTNRTKGNSQYIFLTTVDIFSLKNKTKKLETDQNNNVLQTQVYNIFKKEDFSKISNDPNLSNSLQELIDQIDANKLSVENSNNIANDQRTEIIKTTIENIDKINVEIANLNKQYNQKIIEVNGLLKGINGLILDENIAMDAKIEKGISYIDNLIAFEKKLILKNTEKEIFYNNANVQDEDEPIQGIAKNILSLIEQFNKQYGKVEAFENYKELSTLNTKQNFSETMGAKSIYFRKVNKLWVYIVPGDHGNFNVFLAAEFKIKSNDLNDNANNTLKRFKVSVACNNVTNVAVYIDGEYKGNTPLKNVYVNVEDNPNINIRLMKEGFKTIDKSYTINQEESFLTFEMEKNNTLEDNNKYTTAEEVKPTTPNLENKKDKKNQFSFFSIKVGNGWSNTNTILSTIGTPTLISPYNEIKTLKQDKYIAPSDYSSLFLGLGFDNIKGYQFEVQYASLGANYNENNFSLSALRFTNTLKINLAQYYWIITASLNYDLFLNASYNGTDLSDKINKNSINYGFGTEFNFSKNMGIGLHLYKYLSNLLPDDSGSKFAPTNLQTYLIVRF